MSHYPDRLWFSRKLPDVFCAVVLTVLIISGCSRDFRGGDGTPEATSTADNPTETPVPLMRIVTPTPVDPSSAPQEPSDVPETPSEIPDSYVVAEGDTLYGIAVRFGVDLAEIVAVNGLADPNDIQVGQELIVPKSGDP